MPMAPEVMSSSHTLGVGLICSSFLAIKRRVTPIEQTESTSQRAPKTYPNPSKPLCNPRFDLIFLVLFHLILHC